MNFPENNYELSSKFPPHITLFQGGTMTKGVDELRRIIFSQLDILLKETRGIASNVQASPSGFIAVTCESMGLQKIADDITAKCAKIHAGMQIYRPRIIERLREFSDVELKNVMQTGSSRVASLFMPHISLAQVKPEHGVEAVAIATETISLPIIFKVNKIVLIDSGHQNEKWEIMCQRYVIF